MSTYQDLAQETDKKTILLVMDGLGGIPDSAHEGTELETASTPHMDKLAREGITGLHEPVGPGITPGSGPGHLALFGYDPKEFYIGRGVLSGLGINFDIKPGDVAARGNFCTVDEQGLITDRRAGRIPTEKNRELCERLQEIELSGAKVHVETVKEHRFLLVLQGEGLGSDVNDTDPHETGEKPLTPEAQKEGSEKTAKLLQEFARQASEILADASPANMVLLRGFSSLPDWPTLARSYGVEGAAVASYPMYKGVSRLLGMDVFHAEQSMSEKLRVVRDNWDRYGFFFVHVKKTDSHGEDGSFDKKVKVIEEVDEAIPELLDLGPAVIAITGDHSTPAAMGSHSWHPVPAVIWGQNARPDRVTSFGERACIAGSLGPRLPGHHLIPIAFAHAGQFDKFGA
ncbi:MAG: 2,3-bisphosphoglycerate-independent phosphoglycerate mutase [Spirochaetota bacterium]